MGHKKKPSSCLWLLFSVPSALSVPKSPLATSLSHVQKKALALAATFLWSTTLVNVARAQAKPPQQDRKMPPGMAMPEQMHHQHGDFPLVAPVYPRMGRAQENAGGQLVTLEQAEKMAGETNPTLRQAEAEIRAAKARQQQVGLYPNPIVGYTGDEIRGGSVGGGKQGFFVQQTIVTAGKLGKSREVFGTEAKLAEIEAQEQRTRVTTAVKMAFLRVLAAQEWLEARRDLAKIAEDGAQTQRELRNTGQADESEVLEAEVEAQRMRMAARMQENTLREEWRSLAAVIGQPSLPIATVAGELERGWPELNEEEAVETIAKQSPAVEIAEVATGRAQAVLARAQREPIPDLLLRAGM
jgi:cobalt-zinc-cadmium efflux system outer membrane protein